MPCIVNCFECLSCQFICMFLSTIWLNRFQLSDHECKGYIENMFWYQSDNAISLLFLQCMYVSMYVCIYMYVCMYVCKYIYVCMYIYTYVYIYMYVCIYIYVYMHVCMYLWPLTNDVKCQNLSVCMYVCICSVYIYTYINRTQTHLQLSELESVLVTGILREWPNTYTFTKAMTEHLMVNKRGKVPLAIVRYNNNDDNDMMMMIIIIHFYLCFLWLFVFFVNFFFLKIDILQFSLLLFFSSFQKWTNETYMYIILYIIIKI